MWTHNFDLHIGWKMLIYTYIFDLHLPFFSSQFRRSMAIVVCSNGFVARNSVHILLFMFNKFARRAHSLFFPFVYKIFDFKSVVVKSKPSTLTSLLWCAVVVGNEMGLWFDSVSNLNEHNAKYHLGLPLSHSLAQAGKNNSLILYTNWSW